MYSEWPVGEEYLQLCSFCSFECAKRGRTSAAVEDSECPLWNPTMQQRKKVIVREITDERVNPSA